MSLFVGQAGRRGQVYKGWGGSARHRPDLGKSEARGAAAGRRLPACRPGGVKASEYPRLSRELADRCVLRAAWRARRRKPENPRYLVATSRLCVRRHDPQLGFGK